MSLKPSLERIKYDSDGFGPTGLQDDTNPGFKTREAKPRGKCYCSEAALS